MISVVMPTLNSEGQVSEALSSLVPAAVDGLVREVIIADGGSTDRTLEIADGAGAEIVKCEAGRGAQLRAGAQRTRFPWLLFLNGDTYLDAGWEREATLHIERVESGRRRASAACFRFALDDEGMLPRMLETMASLRTGILKLPYGDQGLLIPRALYDEVGGFSDLPALEDLDLVRRLGRSRITALNARAVTGSERYRREGYLSRLARNQVCLGLYLVGVPVATIANLFGAPPASQIGEPVAQRGLP
jgi:rSAM/selenodomain-associated transferase 2